MNERYVQHLSGQGKVFEIRGEGVQLWMVAETVQGYTDAFFCGLPKSEYVLCEPPARWVDVTKDCLIDGAGIWNRQNGRILSSDCGLSEIGYRLRKVQGKALMATDSAFVVEKKAQP